MKYILSIILLSLSFSSFADMASYCGKIDRFRIWANGGDTYGIWVEYESNPSTCEGGFFLPHQSSNKDYVMSFLLAEKAQGNRICMQVHADIKISNRCRINYVYNP